MSLAIRVNDPVSFVALSSMSSSVSTVASPSSPVNLPSRTSRFSNAGIHQVPAPNLARPGATPPPPPPQLLLRRYQQSEIPSSGFKPIAPTTRPSRTSRRGNTRNEETDVITLENIDKYTSPSSSSSSSSSNKPRGQSFLRSVSSTLQVKRTDDNNNKRGKVFDDIIYEDHGDQFKPSESRTNVHFAKINQPNTLSSSSSSSSSSFGAHYLPQSSSNAYRIYTNTDDIAWRRITR